MILHISRIARVLCTLPCCNFTCIDIVRTSSDLKLSGDCCLTTWFVPSKLLISFLGSIVSQTQVGHVLRMLCLIAKVQHCSLHWCTVPSTIQHASLALWSGMRTMWSVLLVYGYMANCMLETTISSGISIKIVLPSTYTISKDNVTWFLSGNSELR